ncbi:MAG TPA: hypothetical protein VII01_08640, partial [Solirubrobacteraceae bacterium]
MIRSTLANLRGTGSLANELIQNADDADIARELTFRFTPDFLEVIDDGGFRSCGHPNDEGECPWELDGKRPCDFHAFRELGGATKASDATLTGAFGIGFLAVYEITDHPELFSNGIHWTLDDAEESVIVCDGCDQPHRATGTTFRLPWAKRRTRLREQLGAETVSAVDRRRLLRQFLTQVPRAMIFLRKLETIEIIDGRKKIARFTRSTEDGTVRISGPAGEEQWLLLEGDFGTQAKALRKRHPFIADRNAKVRIALQPDDNVSGRLYATLPTAIPTGLALHLDASFFPTIDRKGILLESGYEAEWNRAAITAAAELLSKQVEELAHTLGPKQFWSLISDARKLDRRRAGESKALSAFWAKLAAALPSASVMWTRSETWAKVDKVVSTRRDATLAGLLEDLGVPTISPLIASLVPERALGIERIGLERLVQRLQALSLKDGATIQELPAALQAQRRRAALRRELGALVDANGELDDHMRKALRRLALWEGPDGRFSSFDSSWLVSRDTVEPLARFSPHAFVVWSGRDAASKALAQIGDAYTVDQALTHLEEDASQDLAALTVREARTILAWFKSRLGKLEETDLERLAQLALIPTERGLRSAGETVQTGGFPDPLALTSVLDRKATKGLEQLIARLGVRRLGFADYLREHVAALDPDTEVSIRALTELIRQCARHRDTIDGDQALAVMLADLSWIPCSDGYRRSPREVYFGSPLIREVLGESPPLVHSKIRPNTAAGDLLRLLGVSDVPRPADVIARIADIVAAAPSEHRVAQIIAILRYLSERTGELDSADFAPLRSLDWLPADGEDGWRAPSDLYLTFNRNLFASTGLFIALRRTDQERLRTTLTALGLRSSPPVERVVDHVINLAADEQAPGPEHLRWLDERSSDPHIARLSSCAFLPTTDGRLERPDRVFRHRHPLRPWRAVLRNGLDRFADLLDVLDVAADPDATAAIDVLLEIADRVGAGQTLDTPTLAVVNSCWGMLITATEMEL